MNELVTAGITLAGATGAGGIIIALIRRPIDARLAEASQVTAEAARTTAEAAITKVAGEHLTAVYGQLQVKSATLDSLIEARAEHLPACPSPADDVLRRWRPPAPRPSSG